MYQNAELLEIWYRIAPHLLQGEGASWTYDGKARDIIEWRWLRHSSFLRGLAIYEDGFKIGFGHVGRSLTSAMFRRRWESRFLSNGKLVVKSWAKLEESRRDWWTEGLDPDADVDPVLSGYVISGDYRGIEIAKQVLSPHGSYVFVDGRPNAVPLYRGRAHPSAYDDIADQFEDVGLHRLDRILF